MFGPFYGEYDFAFPRPPASSFVDRASDYVGTPRERLYGFVRTRREIRSLPERAAAH